MIRLIAIIDKKRGMAKQGDQPWHLPTDEKYFLDQTSKYGGVVIMGRTTFEVIGHPLKDRRNIVVSRSLGPTEGVEIIGDLEQALHAAEDVWVIGGAKIFADSLRFANELYLTEVATDADCDKFFPDFEEAFELASKSEPHTEEGFTYRFNVYRRKS